MDSAFVSVDTPINPKQPLKKVISINGEMVDANDIENMNIHDFSTYEQEQLLTGQYMSRIRRKTYPQSGTKKELRKQLSFHEVTRDVIRVEHVLLAFKHYKHRSDSDTDDSDDDGTGETRKNKASNRTSTTNNSPSNRACSQPSSTGAQIHVSSPSRSHSGSSVKMSSYGDTTKLHNNNNVTRKPGSQEQAHAGTYESNAHTCQNPNGHQNERDHLVASTSSLPNPSTNNNGSKGQASGPVDGSGSTTGCPCVIL